MPNVVIADELIGNIKSSYQLKRKLQGVDDSYLKEKLEKFILKTRPSRFIGTRGHANAQVYIQEELKKISRGQIETKKFSPNFDKALKFYQDDFNKKIASSYTPSDQTYKKWKAFTDSMINTIKKLKSKEGVNIHFTLKGQSAKKIIIGTSYDTLLINPDNYLIDTTNPMPGADNNASGVIIALELAKIFSKFKLNQTIEIVFFDMQEIGFLGSDHYVSQLKDKSNIEFYTDLVMLGYDTKISDAEKDNGNFHLYLKRGNSKTLPEALIAEKIIKFGNKFTSKVDFTLKASGFNSSDVINFQSVEIPSLCFTQNWETDLNPRHHTPNDSLEFINYSTLEGVLQYIAGGILSFTFSLDR